MQTWEYSPLIKLRSYAYLLPHVIVGKLIGLVLEISGKSGSHDKIMVFYGIRVVLACVSAFCEATFVKAINRRFGYT